VVFAPDENLLNNELIETFLVFPPGTNYNDVVINEIMYAPLTGEPEWVELFNNTNQSINLGGWRFADATSGVILGPPVGPVIGPNDFIILSASESIYNFYNIPVEVLVLNLPSLNNSGDILTLTDFNENLIDSVAYNPTWGGSNGHSLERISSEAESNDPLNWGTSISIYKATPGVINSITQKDFDIAVSEILFNPQFPLKGDTVSISAKVKNPGLYDANFSLQLFEDTNLDSIPDLLVDELQNLFLSAKDSNVYSFNYSIENIQSRTGFLVNAIFPADQDTTNNKIYKTIEPGLPPQSIVINEIMYSPLGGEPEWIELYNRTNEVINLNGWSINDVYTTPTYAVIEEDVFIEPNSYLVLSRSSDIYNFHRFIPSGVFILPIPSLNNDVDGVVVKDDRGLQIDSVLYFSQWGGTNGHSLERVSVDAGSNLATNWGSSFDIEESTPGRINSLTPKQFDLSVAGLNFNPRFPTEGEDVFISASIKNNGSSNANNFNVEFYIDTDSNNVVDQLLSLEAGLSLAAGDSLNVTSTSPIQNLTSKILTAVRVVFTEDEDTLNNYLERTVEPGYPGGIVLINEVMYNPATNEPEWVEVVNVSGEEINIKNWSVSDVLTIPTKNFITTDDVILQPNEYIVITKDTSLFKSAHPEVTVKVFGSIFGNLSNTADGVIIYDFRDGIIDSLFYRSSWGGAKGLSLERISLEDATNDSTNWTTSLSPKGSTPGAPNSIGNVPNYSRNDLVINEIMFDPGDDNCEFIEFLNLSGDSVNVGGWKIEDENENNYRLSEFPLMVPNNSYFILAADSLINSKYSLDETVLRTVIGVSSLGLVNTGELILLKDVKGNVIDSVFYSDKWHNDNFVSTKNISLERINPNLGANDPNNWSSSVDPIGATPGKQNSIYTVNLNKESNISVSPNPFSPDNDGFEDFTIINYNLTQATSQVRIKIFDSKGRLVRTLDNNQPSGQSGSVIFDGIGDDGQALRIGIYIIFLEAINEGAGVVETMKTVVVVARKL
ncbi:MAG: lamin tail domain-containing protein, partial [Ignavibacteriaceae bacterium]|nr:lamin tail domain-containing protein [Ignavibacteriaceae bacterium]